MADHSVVYVHGISHHDEGYSDTWYDAVRPYLTKSLPKHEVRWSDIVNAEAMTHGASGAEYEAKYAAETELKREIEEELNRRKRNNLQLSQEAVPANAEQFYGSGPSGLDDFVRYMIWKSTRESILSRFNDIVLPLLQDGQKLHILAHSWGTVVSYEGLRYLDNDGLPGRVANLFLLGSALSIGAVQRNLLRRVRSGSKPCLVEKLINIDAGGDVVGGNLHPTFDADAQHLNMIPTGCPMFRLRRIFRRHTAKNPVCAHRSYFEHNNLAVNRDIIGTAINRQLA